MAHLPTSGFPRCTQQYPTAAHTPPDTTPFHTTATVIDVRSLGVGRMTATGRRRGALTDVGFSEMYSAIPDRSSHSSGHHAIPHHSNRHRCAVAGRGQDDRRLTDGLRAWSDGPERFGTGILPDDGHQEKQVLGLRLSVFRCKTCYQVIPCGGQLRCCPHGLGFSILCDS